MLCLEGLSVEFVDLCRNQKFRQGIVIINLMTVHKDGVFMIYGSSAG